MTNYLSPERARRMPLGIELPSTDLALVDLLSQAQAVVDAYCQLPQMPYPVDFLGGVGIVEEHRWRFPDSPFGPYQRRIYPYHWPVRAVTEFLIEVGAGSRATIPTDALVINNTEKWIEITALSIVNASGIFGVTGWVVPIGGLQQPKAIVTLDCGWQIAETDDTCYALDGTNTVFVASHEHWIEDATTPEIKVAGTPVTPAAIDYLLGTVTFGSPQTGRVTATYRHKLSREIPLATGYVAARLQGDVLLREKDMEGLESIKDDTIEITRPRLRSSPRLDEGWLEREVPAAAQLLGGFKAWRIG